MRSLLILNRFIFALVSDFEGRFFLLFSRMVFISLALDLFRKSSRLALRHLLANAMSSDFFSDFVGAASFDIGISGAKAFASSSSVCSRDYKEFLYVVAAISNWEIISVVSGFVF